MQHLQNCTKKKKLSEIWPQRKCQTISHKIAKNTHLKHKLHNQDREKKVQTNDTLPVTD